MFEMPPLFPLVEGGVNGGRDVAGEDTRLALDSVVGFVDGPATGIMGGCVAEVGVGSGGGTLLAEVLELARRFLLGWPLE